MTLNNAKRTAFPAASLLAIAIVVLGFFAGFAAQAQNQRENSQDQLDEWSLQVERGENTLSNSRLADPQLESLLRELDALAIELRAGAASARAQAETKRGLLLALGPAPAEGETPEDEEVANQRASLNSEVSLFQGQAQRIEVLLSRIEIMQTEIAQRRRASFAERLFKRDVNPFTLNAWRGALATGVSQIGRLSGAAKDLLIRPELRDNLIAGLPTVLLALVFAIALWGFARRYLLTSVHKLLLERVHGSTGTVLAGGLRALAWGAAPIFALLAVYYAFTLQGLLPRLTGYIADAVVWPLSFFFLTTAMVTAYLGQRHGGARLVPISDQLAWRLAGLLRLLAGVLAIDLAVFILSPRVLPANELNAVHGLLANGTEAVLLFMILWLVSRARQEQRQKQRETSATAVHAIAQDSIKTSTRLSVLVLIGGLWLTAVLVLMAAVMGYDNLGRYLSLRMGAAAPMVATLYLLHLTAKVLLSQATGLEAETDTVDTSRPFLRYWTLFGIDLVLVMLGLVLAMRLFGDNWDVLSSIAQSAVYGFSIGSYQVSPAAIGAALLLFLVIAGATNILKKVVDERLLPQTRLDIGARTSIKAAIGYLGLIIAALASAGALGVDFSNLAIVAGALSVGIGFGLQNVVNNFVSGVLLLIERPMKVGDWVVIGDKEGTVKNIRVRATEIETFDRATVIIPNSTIISGDVVNWTHKNRMARVILKLGVAYGSDMEKVRTILETLAKDHPDILSYPAPFVVFADFGSSSLDLELRVYVRDTDYFLSVASELRFAIDKAFRAEGIEIPFPQRDIHIRTSPPSDPDGIGPGSHGGEAGYKMRSGVHRKSELGDDGSGGDNDGGGED